MTQLTVSLRYSTGSRATENEAMAGGGRGGGACSSGMPDQPVVPVRRVMPSGTVRVARWGGKGYQWRIARWHGSCWVLMRTDACQAAWGVSKVFSNGRCRGQAREVQSGRTRIPHCVRIVRWREQTTNTPRLGPRSKQGKHSSCHPYSHSSLTAPLQRRSLATPSDD